MYSFKFFLSLQLIFNQLDIMKKVALLSILISVLLFSVKAQMYFSEDFESNSLPSGWQNLDQDGDGKKWVFSSGMAVSYSWYNSALTPNNWLITKAINLSQATAPLSLSFYVGAYHESYPLEHYEVRISTTNNSVSSFNTTLHSETINQGGQWLHRTVDVSAYAGQTIYLAFIHNNTYDQYALVLDEIAIVGANEIELGSITTPDYVQKGSNTSVKGKVYNLGSSSLTSYEVTYSINNGPESPVYTVTGINVAQGNSHQFTHNIPMPTNESGSYTLKVTVSKPNGVNDNTDNNVLSKTITIYGSKTTHRTLLEHFTTAQCSGCPSATTQIKSWLNSRPDVIWLSHHAGYYTDGLTISANTTLLTFYNDGGSTYTPAIMLDRRWLAPDGDPGPVFSVGNGVPTLLDQVRNDPAFVTVNFSDVNYNTSTRDLTFTVYGEFANTISANSLRLSLYVREDNLKTTPGQSGSSAGINYIHNNVMRATVSNVWGESNVITSGTEGSTYSKTFTYTIPSNFKLDDLSFIAFVSKYNSSVNERDVLNAKAVSFNDLLAGNFPIDEVEEPEDPENPEDPVGIFDKSTENGGVILFPNPVNDALYLLSDKNIQEVEILNINGQLISRLNYSHTSISTSHLSAGIYLLRLITEEGVFVKKFIKE